MQFTDTPHEILAREAEYFGEAQNVHEVLENRFTQTHVVDLSAMIGSLVEKVALKTLHEDSDSDAERADDECADNLPVDVKRDKRGLRYFLLRSAGFVQSTIGVTHGTTCRLAAER